MRLAGWAHVRERAFSDVWTLAQVPNLSPLDALYGMNVVSHEVNSGAHLEGSYRSSDWALKRSDGHTCACSSAKS